MSTPRPRYDASSTAAGSSGSSAHTCAVTGPVLVGALPVLPALKPKPTSLSIVLPARPFAPPALRTVTITCGGARSSPAEIRVSVHGAASTFSGNGSVTRDHAHATP